MTAPETIQIASLGMADSLILMVMALVVFGPRRLPQIGRQIGKLMYEFRKASNDFKFQMEEELRLAEESDRQKKEEERLKALAAAAPTPAALPAESPLAAPTDTAASPYPGEGVYPAGDAAVEPMAEQQTAEPVEEEAYPRILPPSTGETVPAARPGRFTGENASEELAAAPDAAPGSAPDAVPVEPGSPVTETGVQHG